MSFNHESVLSLRQSSSSHSFVDLTTEYLGRTRRFRATRFLIGPSRSHRRGFIVLKNLRSSTGHQAVEPTTWLLRPPPRSKQELNVDDARRPPQNLLLLCLYKNNDRTTVSGPPRRVATATHSLPSLEPLTVPCRYHGHRRREEEEGGRVRA